MTVLGMFFRTVLLLHSQAVIIGKTLKVSSACLFSPSGPDCFSQLSNLYEPKNTTRTLRSASCCGEGLHPEWVNYVAREVSRRRNSFRWKSGFDHHGGFWWRGNRSRRSLIEGDSARSAYSWLPCRFRHPWLNARACSKSQPRNPAVRTLSDRKSSQICR